MYCVLYIDKTITNGDKEKKDMKKRLFSGFLALMMVFTLVNPMSFTARADENTVEETQVQSDESTVEETQVQSDESTVEETQVQSDESTVGETQVQSDESTVEETQVQSGESTVGETQVQSDDSTVDGIFKNVQAEEVSGTPRLDAISGNIGNSAEDRPVSYRDDEMVTIIVELEEAPLMDAYVMNPYTVRDDETAGEAVAEFLASDAAMQAADELRSEQQALFNEIQAMQPAVMSTEEDETLSLVTLTAQWTVLVNGMAVKAPYGMLAGIRELDGVKRAYVEHTYDEPKEPVTEAGAIAGYSYDMVHLSEAWEAGYTGKGLLVAVLDTGVDIESAAWFDDEKNENVFGIRRVHEAFRDNSFKSDVKDSELRYTKESLLSFLSD